jgi:DNA-binding CsgD family transcriptional regulator
MERGGEAGALTQHRPVVDGLVGREEELARVDSFLVSSHVMTMVLEGEAGIGKTVLWEAGVAAARSNDFRVLACRPVAAEASLSYVALGDLFAPVLEETLSLLPPPQRRALELALLLRQPGDRPPDGRAIGLALVAVLKGLARSSGLLVAIDDAHWVDPASAIPLEFAVRRLEGDQVKVLATVRVEEKRTAALRFDRSFDQGVVERVDVSPLSLGAIRRLLGSRLDVSLSRPVLLRVHEASGGNPLFALEVARALGQGDRLEASRRVEVPDDLDELLGARLARLPRRVLDVVAAAAAMSDPTVSALSTVADGDREGVVADLDAAAAAGITELDDGRVRFTHPLLASSAYWRLDDAARRRLHHRLATVASDVEERARHLALAAAGPDEEVADTLEAAAVHAAARGAAGAAAELTELALRLTPPHHFSASRRRQVQTAERYFDVGDLVRAREILEALRRELESGPERVDVLILLARAEQDNLEAQGDLLEEALGDAAGDPARLARVRRGLAEAAAARGDQQGALAHARAAIVSAEQSNDTALLAATLAYVALFETFLGEITPGLLERAVELEPTAGYLSAYESPGVVLAYRFLYQDRVDEARHWFEVAAANARTHDDFTAQLTLLLHLTEVELIAGNWELASAMAADGLELAEQLDSDHYRSALLYVAAKADANLGHVDAAHDHASEGVSLAREVKTEVYEFNNQRVLGFVALSLRDYAGAVAALEPLLAFGLASSRSGLCALLPDLVEALVGAGDVARARELVEILERNVAEFRRPTAMAAASRCRGMVQSAENHLETAMVAFHDALRSYEPVANPLERARTLLALGETQRRARQRRAARQTLEIALEEFEQLDAPLWGELARRELARIGGRAPSAGGLTPTEEQVAALVVEGYTNREAASSLHVSEHTIEGHLSRIYAKLGVTSRTELAYHLTRDRRDGAHR